MIQPASGFGLPLMYHLVAERLRHTRPAVAREMPPADHDLVTSHRGQPELSQPAPHSSRQRHPHLAESAGKVPFVERAMELVEPDKEALVARPGPRRSAVLGGFGWHVLLHRKRDEDSLRRESLRPSSARPGPTDDRDEHVFRSKSMTEMDPEGSPYRERNQNPVIRMPDDLRLPREAGGAQTVGKAVSG